MLNYTGDKVEIGEQVSQYNNNIKAEGNHNFRVNEGVYKKIKILIDCEKILLTIFDLSLKHDKNWFNKKKQILLSHIQYIQASRKYQSLDESQELKKWAKVVNEYKQANLSRELIINNGDGSFNSLLRDNEAMYNRLLPYVNCPDTPIINILANQFVSSLNLTLSMACWHFPEWIKGNLSIIKNQLSNLQGKTILKSSSLNCDFAESLVSENNSTFKYIISSAVSFIALPGYDYIDTKINDRKYETIKPIIDDEYKKITEHNREIMRALAENETYIEDMRIYFDDLCVHKHELICELNENLSKTKDLELNEDEKKLLTGMEFNLYDYGTYGTDTDNLNDDERQLLEGLNNGTVNDQAMTVSNAVIKQGIFSSANRVIPRASSSSAVASINSL